MYIKKANLHLHSLGSDGIHTTLAILAYAKVLGVDVLSITDHNEIRGSLRGAKIAKALGIIFFPGIELLFLADGLVFELLAYFKEVEDIKSFYKEYRFTNGFMPTFNSVLEVVELIKAHNGVVAAPHPFGRKGIYRKGKNKGLNVDAVEIINAFTGEKRNIKAKNHQDKDCNFLRLGAADMHFFLGDISKVYTELSSKTEINSEVLWQNLKGEKKTIKFAPRGKGFRPHKIFFQKPLCTVVYALNYPRLYFSYRLNKYRFNLHKNKEAISNKILD